MMPDALREAAYARLLQDLLDAKADRIRAGAAEAFTVDEARVDETLGPPRSQRERAARWGWTHRNVRTLDAGGDPATAPTPTQARHSTDTAPTQKAPVLGQNEAQPTQHRHSADTAPHTPTPSLLNTPPPPVGGLPPQGEGPAPKAPPEAPRPTPEAKPRSRRRAFTPPTAAEVAAYAAEAGLPHAPAAAFVDHFAANGWRVSGRAPMQDWQAAYRNWCRREAQFARPAPNAARPAAAPLNLAEPILRRDLPRALREHPRLAEADFYAHPADWRGEPMLKLLPESRHLLTAEASHVG